MEPRKEFDCVEMKRHIQEKVAKELEGLTPEEAQVRRKQLIESDPRLGPLVRRIRKVRPASVRRE